MKKPALSKVELSRQLEKEQAYWEAKAGSTVAAHKVEIKEKELRFLYRIVDGKGDKELIMEKLNLNLKRLENSSEGGKERKERDTWERS